MKFDFDFLKSRYDEELKRKKQIAAALTLPVSVLFVLGALMIAMAQSFSYMDGFLTCLFLIFLGLAAFAFLICVVYVGRAYYPRPYMYLPHLGDLHKNRGAWQEHYKQAYLGESYKQIGSYGRSSPQHEEYVDDLFQRWLEMRMIEATDENTNINNTRSDRYLHLAWVALFSVLGSIAIAGVPYVLDQVRY